MARMSEFVSCGIWVTTAGKCFLAYRTQRVCLATWRQSVVFYSNVIGNERQAGLSSKLASENNIRID